LGGKNVKDRLTKLITWLIWPQSHCKFCKAVRLFLRISNIVLALVQAP